MSAAEKILQEKFEKSVTAVLYLRGDGLEEESYAYLAIRPSAWGGLKAALESRQPLVLEDYGTVLASGIGEPAESLKAEMKEKYGVAS